MFNFSIILNYKNQTQHTVFVVKKIMKCFLLLFCNNQKKENIAFFLNLEKVIFVKKPRVINFRDIYIILR